MTFDVELTADGDIATTSYGDFATVEGNDLYIQRIGIDALKAAKTHSGEPNTEEGIAQFKTILRQRLSENQHIDSVRRIVVEPSNDETLDVRVKTASSDVSFQL